MCEVLDRAIAKGRAEGWQSGQAEGRLEGETKVSCLLGKLLKDG